MDKKISTPRKKPGAKAKKPVKKLPTAVFSKLSKNPIISPVDGHGWESWQTFNSGAILLNDQIHLMYRAIGEDGVSRLGYAISEDGISISDRLPFPVYEHLAPHGPYDYFSYASGGSWGGAEDPRLMRVEDENLVYMTYTACDNGLRVALASIDLDDFLANRWTWKPVKLISKPNAVNKNWVIFPEKIKGRYAILTSLSPRIHITYLDNLDFSDGKAIGSSHGGNKEGAWENYVRGVGPPPIKTKYGWLVLYHAMDRKDPGKYKVGAMILDLNDPTKIVYRARKPILEPSEHYESNGFKPGVVYTTGAVVKGDDLLVYYGGADSYVCVASIKLDEFLRALVTGDRLSLQHRPLKAKYDRSKV